MADPKNTTVLKNGQLAVATAPQSGTIVSAASEKDTTALVETADGTQLCVKTVSLGGGGGGGSVAWGDIEGTLSNQTDLQTALNSKVQNTATGAQSITLYGTPTNATQGVNIGYFSESVNGSLALGSGAKATGFRAVQLGSGTNSVDDSFQVKSYQILDANGKIPADRMARVVELTTTSVELASDTIYNGAELASVTFTLPATVPANFTAQLNFTSGTTATTFTAPASVTFEGDACSNGVFTPLASKRYSVLIYTDGVNVIGLVMGN